MGKYSNCFYIYQTKSFSDETGCHTIPIRATMVWKFICSIFPRSSTNIRSHPDSAFEKLKYNFLHHRNQYWVRCSQFFSLRVATTPFKQDWLSSIYFTAHLNGV